MVSFVPEAESYIERIRDSIQKVWVHEQPRLAVCDLVPGIAFREIWPYDSDGGWTPLDTYRTDVSDDQRRHIPRKHQPETAKWLLRSFARLLRAKPSAREVRILCIGDGDGDVKLTEHMNDLLEEFPNVASSATAHIYRGAHVARRTGATTVWHESWSRLANEVIDTVAGSPDVLFLMVVDVDRTLLLPRGLCDEVALSIGHRAFHAFIGDFSIGPLGSEEVDRCYTQATEFKPYGDESGAYHKDEDVRVFAGLARITGLFSEQEWVAHTAKSMGWWLQTAARRCARGGWRPQLVGDRVWSPAEAWNEEALADELGRQYIQFSSLDCSFSTRYRNREAEIFRKLVQADQCTLNGHVVDILKSGTELGRVLPVAYSDRPGSSVGLQLMSYYKSRPPLRGKSLIEEPLPLQREL